MTAQSGILTESQQTQIKVLCDTYQGPHLIGETLFRCVSLMLENSQKRIPSLSTLDRKGVLMALLAKFKPGIYKPAEVRVLVVNLITELSVKYISGAGTDDPVRTYVDQTLIEENLFPELTISP
jgi:hypothetical protein